MTLRHGLAAVALALAACSPGVAQKQETRPVAEADRHPVSGLEVVPLTVHSARGPSASKWRAARRNSRAG